MLTTGQMTGAIGRADARRSSEQAARKLATQARRARAARCRDPLTQPRTWRRKPARGRPAPPSAT